MDLNFVFRKRISERQSDKKREKEKTSVKTFLKESIRFKKKNLFVENFSELTILNVFEKLIFIFYARTDENKAGAVQSDDGKRDARQKRTAVFRQRGEPYNRRRRQIFEVV